MNILLLPSWGYSSFKGMRGVNGPELRFLWLAEEYARNNMHVHIIYPLDGALYQRYAELNTQYAAITCTFFEKFNKVSYLLTALRITRSHKGAVIQTHGGVYLDFVGCLCSLFHKYKKHVCGKAIVNKHEQSLAVIVKCSLVDLFCKFCGSQFVTISKFHKAEFLKQSNFIYGNIQVIYNGVVSKLRRIAPTAKQKDVNEKHKIICVAQFTPVKNHNRLLEIMQRLEATNKQGKLYELTLVGNGPLAEKLVPQFTSKLSMRVSYLDHVIDILREIKRHDTLILVSRREGVPLCVIQAMLLGLGVVTTDTGAIREVLPTKAGYLVSDDDDEIVQHLISGFKPDLDQNMLRIYRERFSIETMANSYIKLFKTL